MKNPIVESLQDFFEKVHNGDMGRKVALERFCFLNEGIAYIPKIPFKKKDTIINMFEFGFKDVEIAESKKLDIAYVRKVIKNHIKRG